MWRIRAIDKFVNDQQRYQDSQNDHDGRTHQRDRKMFLKHIHEICKMELNDLDLPHTLPEWEKVDTHSSMQATLSHWKHS